MMLAVLACVGVAVSARSAEPPASPLACLHPVAFSGVRPGSATLADVQEAWGRPTKVTRHGTSVEHVYRVEPASSIEVTFHKDRVVSLVIQLREAFESSVLAEQMELAAFAPVMVENEAGAVVGVAWPERGVSFGFVAGVQSQQVTRIVLDVISVEPFLLRAAASAGLDDTACLKDIETVLALAPKTPRALALRAEVQCASGRYDEAIADCRAAENMDVTAPEYRLLHAAILAEMGRYDQAITTTEQAMSLCGRKPELRARALSQLGTYVAFGPKHEYKTALDQQQQAIRQIEPLLNEKRSDVRRLARDVLVEAHVGTASAIAHGSWPSKKEAVEKWLERANQLASRAETAELRSQATIKLCRGALEACAAAGGVVDPTPWAVALEDVGRRRLKMIRDPRTSSALAWELGQAMFSAMLASQARGDFTTAQAKGALAVGYLEMAIPQRGHSVNDTLVLANVYYRLGSMAAVDQKNHAQAVGWFDRAVPLVDEALPGASAAECGRQGQALVSMGVSYWELGRHDRSLELTRRGVECLEKSVKQGAIAKDSLAVGYTNLASIHKFLGNEDRAKNFGELAAQAKRTQVK
jgi:tetratricopeptide (TPR) repeat protein